MQSHRSLESEKHVIFQVASYWYILPVAEILKIVNCPSSRNGGMVQLGMVQLGPHTVHLLNLHHLFEMDSDRAVAYDFLIVLQSQNGLWGIPLEHTPDLIELPHDTLRPVSLSGERHSPCISHVGIISEQTGNRTLLQLDVHALTRRGVHSL